MAILLSPMRNGAHRALAAMALALAAPAQAHEVVNEIQLRQAVTVTLEYSDGEPFSYETYELYAGHGKTPVQTGRTDAHGRVVFLPGQEDAMRLRAFSADGHGVDLRFQVPAASPEAAAGGEADTAAALGRPAKLLAGLAAILMLFAGWQLFVRKKNKP
ncbi:ABC transporter permease [Pusillimonas sp.]|uniref:ABC transporter permease n=1 Tax=Pusillimonas sp. TaxID=3040095 RepID=UPI0029AFB9B4|nr:ABC transporter permease [Pusillimonas sp.]MDX3894476.1 ABC transporter permease [Pusillimonas sp.]